MSSQVLTKAIRTFYRTAVLSVQSVPTQFDNQGDVVQTGLWCRCTILIFTTEQADICPGAPRVRSKGEAVFSVFDGVTKGDKPARTFADLIVANMQLQTNGGVLYRAGRVVTVGRDGPWWQLNATLPFQYDEIVT